VQAVDAAHNDYNISTMLDISDIWQGRTGVKPFWQTAIVDILGDASKRLKTGAVLGLFLGE
jgi:hypothetical protein